MRFLPFFIERDDENNAIRQFLKSFPESFLLIFFPGSNAHFFFVHVFLLHAE